MATKSGDETSKGVPESDLPQFLIHGQGGSADLHGSGSSAAKLPPVTNDELRWDVEEQESDPGSDITRTTNIGARPDEELLAADRLCQLLYADADTSRNPDGEKGLGGQAAWKGEAEQELRYDAIQEGTALKDLIAGREATEECVLDDSEQRKATEARQGYEELGATERTQHQRQEGGSEAGRFHDGMNKAPACGHSGGGQKHEEAEETIAMAEQRKFETTKQLVCAGSEAKTHVVTDKRQEKAELPGETEESQGKTASAGGQQRGEVTKERNVEWEIVKEYVGADCERGQNVDTWKGKNGVWMWAMQQEWQEDRATRGHEVEEEVGEATACEDSGGARTLCIEGRRPLEAGNGDDASTIGCVLFDSEKIQDAGAGQEQGGTGQPEEERGEWWGGASGGGEGAGEADEECHLELQVTQELVCDDRRGVESVDLLKQGIEGIGEAEGRKHRENTDEMASERGGMDTEAADVAARPQRRGDHTADTDEIREGAAVYKKERVREARSLEAQRAGQSPPISRASEVTKGCARGGPGGEQDADIEQDAEQEGAGAPKRENQEQERGQEEGGGNDGWEWARELILYEQQAADTRVASYPTEYEWEDVELPVDCAGATEPASVKNSHASLSIANSNTPTSDPISDDVRSTGFSPEAFVEMEPETYSASTVESVDGEAQRSVGGAGETHAPSPVWHCSPGVFTSATQAGVTLESSLGANQTERCRDVMDEMNGQCVKTVDAAEHGGRDGGAFVGEEQGGLAKTFGEELTGPAVGCEGEELEADYGSPRTREWLDEFNGTGVLQDADACVETSMLPPHRSLPPAEHTELSATKPLLPPQPLISSAVSPYPSVPSEAIKIDRVEVRRSITCGEGGGVTGCGGESVVGDTSEFGVFCEGAAKRGDLIFREDSLLRVSRSAVDHAVWDTVTLVTEKVAEADMLSRMASSKRLGEAAGVEAMDLLQAVAYYKSDPSVQRRVLNLFAPDEAAFPPDRLKFWSTALDMMHETGAVSFSGATSSSVADGEFQGASRNGATKLKWQQRSKLLRVLRICEGNIFGETNEDDEEHGSRSLFETACRINHSCFPNCSYTVEDGRITIRAMTDLDAGAELLVSYLSFDVAMCPTTARRAELLSTKYFHCRCCRCNAQHDLSRGFRCPCCQKGSIYPPTAHLQHKQPAVAPCSETVGQFCAGSGDIHGCPGAEMSDVSVCTACGRVPTARWLRSAEKLERFLEGLLETLLGSWDLKTAKLVTMVYAAGLYLFADHHLMGSVHEYMAALLEYEARMHEAAYHQHQRLAIFHQTFDRPTRSMADAYVQLSNTLMSATGLNPARPQVPSGSWIPPLVGRCGTYATLVRSLPPRSVSGKADPKEVGSTVTSFALDYARAPSQSNKFSGAAARKTDPDPPGRHADRFALRSGLGSCVVCGRRHGRACDWSPSHHNDSGQPSCGRRWDKGSQGGSPRNSERQLDNAVCLEDCVHALEAGVDVYSTIYGGDGQATMELCEGLDGVKVLVERALGSSKQ